MALPASIYDQLKIRAGRERVPLFVLCNLTYRCRLACGHCYVGAPAPGQTELSTAEYERLFDALAAEGTLFLTFSGGEVLCRGDFMALVAAARARRFGVRVFTSGVGLDEAVADALAAARVLAVEITLHAATAARHDAFAGRPGAWEEAVAAARRLRARSVGVALKITAMNFNAADVPAVHRLARELGCEFRHSPYVSVANDGDRRPLAFRMTDAQLATYFDAYGNIPAPLGAEPPPPSELCDDDGRPFRPNRYALSCLASFNSCSVDPYGVVWPCVGFPLAVGDVRRESFRDVWRGEAMERFRANARREVAECASCAYDAFCARCAAFGFLEEGDIARANREHCRIARAAKEAADRSQP